MDENMKEDLESRRDEILEQVAILDAEMKECFGKFPEKWMKIFNERYKLLVELGELGDVLRILNYIDEIVVD